MHFERCCYYDTFKLLLVSYSRQQKFVSNSWNMRWNFFTSFALLLVALVDATSLRSQFLHGAKSFRSQFLHGVAQQPSTGPNDSSNIGVSTQQNFEIGEDSIEATLPTNDFAKGGGEVKKEGSPAQVQDLQQSTSDHLQNNAPKNANHMQPQSGSF